MSGRSVLALITATVLYPMPVAFGDSVLLNDGTQYEGRIVAEDAITVTLEIKMHGITLKRRLNRLDIKQITLGQAPAAPDLDKADIEKIKKADSVEELQRLGARFFKKNETQAAAQCVTKACAMDSSLLDSVVPLAPPEWQVFWHAQVLELCEAKLPAADAPARVTLAKWAHRAGLPDDAQRLLGRAMQLDPSLTEAKELAELWQLQAGGPVRIDLRLGLSQPLMPDSMEDEQQEITARPRFRLAIVPFEYRPAAEPPNISRTTCTFRTGAGQVCRLLGIALLEAERHGRREAGPGLALRMQAADEPLWERIEPMLREGEIILRCYNTYRPRRRPGTLERRERGTSTPPRTGTRDRYEAERGRYRPTPSRDERTRYESGTRTRTPPELTRPRPRPRGESSERITRGERTGSGYAAFVIEFPDDAEVLAFAFQKGVPVQMTRSLLASAHEKLDKLSGPELEDEIAGLTKFITGTSGVDALLAAAKLAEWRSSTADEADTEQAVLADRGLIKAFAHSDAPTRRQAWDAFASRGWLDEPTRRLISSESDVHLLNGLLETAEQVLKAAGTGAEGEDVELPRERYRGSSRRGDKELAVIASRLPESRAEPGAFAVLSALLASSNKSVAVRTVELLLSDATKQSIAVFADANDTARGALLEKLADVADEEVKTTAIKTLMIHPSASLLEKIGAAARGLTFRVEDENDPLLKTGAQTKDPAVALAVLDLLGRASLQSVLATGSGAEMFTKMTEEDAGKAVRQRAIELLVRQWKSAGPSCWSREHSRERGIQSVLAKAACDPDQEVHRAAVAALIRAGGVQDLQDELRRADGAVRLDIVRHLADAKDLWKFDSAMMLLAAMLDDRDEKTTRAALETIDSIYEAHPASGRWRLRMALKKDMEWRKLTGLLRSSDPKTVQLVRKLVGELAAVNDDERRQLKTQGGERELADFLGKLDARRVDDPAGQYAALIHVDLLIPPAHGFSAEAASASRRRSRSSREPGWVRVSASFVIGQVAIEVIGEQQKRVRVEWAEQTLATGELSRGGDRRRRGSGASAQFVMNVGPPARKALESGRLDPEIAAKVDLAALPESISVVVEHVGQGQWAGQKDLTGERRRRSDSRVGQPVYDPQAGARVAAVGIVLELIQL